MASYLQRKKGTHFLTNYMGYLMLQKVENTLGFIMISGQGFQGKLKNLDFIWKFLFEREIALLETGNHQGNREINPVNIALISHMRCF